MVWQTEKSLNYFLAITLLIYYIYAGSASIGAYGGHYTSYIAIVHRSILYYINLYPTKVYEYLMLELNCSVNLRVALPVGPSVLETGYRLCWESQYC